MNEPLAAHPVNVLPGSLLLIGCLQLRPGIFARLGGKGRVLEINRDHARGTLGAEGHRGRNLQHPQATDKVHMENR